MKTIKTNINEYITAFDRRTSAILGVPERAALLARGMITQELVNALGEAKAKHFEVAVVTAPMGLGVVIRANDEVAHYIASGTQPHNISVGNGTAMPIGGGMFATSVSHPGTDGHEEAIRGAVLSGASAAWAMAITYG